MYGQYFVLFLFSFDFSFLVIFIIRLVFFTSPCEQNITETCSCVLTPLFMDKKSCSINLSKLSVDHRHRLRKKLLASLCFSTLLLGNQLFVFENVFIQKHIKQGHNYMQYSAKYYGSGKNILIQRISSNRSFTVYKIYLHLVTFYPILNKDLPLHQTD